MQMKRWIPLLLVGALAAAGLAGFGAIGKVSAQSGSTAAGSTAGSSTATTNGSELFGRGERGGYTSQELATALGITSEALTQAQAEAKSAALAQAVTDGLITQAQADELAANGSAFPLGGRWGSWLSAKGIDFDTFLADALGITPEELTVARAEALDAHLAALVADGSITQDQADLMKARQVLAASDQFASDLQSAYESVLAKAVSNGTITQAQADLLLANATEKGGFGMGGLGGMGGGRHGR